jgi:hypothetical protein
MTRMWNQQPFTIEGTMNEETLVAYAPSEDWRKAFEKQATRAMLDKLNRIARARLGVYCGGKHRVQDSDVDDIVIAALGDTWGGTLRWDPGHKTLFAHLKDAVKFRVRNEAKLARKRRKHDEFEEDDRGASIAGQIAAGAVAPTITTRDGRDAIIGHAVDDVIAALRPIAARDSEVTSILDALAKRLVDRNDVIEETGMTIPEYNNAWRRLGRMMRELPAQLRDHALAALA